MEQRKSYSHPSKEVEVTADPNTNTSPNAASFDRLISKSILQGLSHLPKLPGDVKEVNVDNFISFTPNINVSVPQKPHDSNYSLLRAKEGSPRHGHGVLLGALMRSIKSLRNEIVNNSPPLPPNQGTLKGLLMRNLCFTDMLLADQRRLVKRYYHLCNATEEYAPTTSPPGKARTDEVRQCAKGRNNTLGSSKNNGVVPNLMGRDGPETEDPNEIVPKFKCGEDVEITPATSPQVSPNKLSANPSELLDIKLSWFAQQNRTKSANNSRIPGADRISEEAERGYDSSSTTDLEVEEDDSTTGLSSEPSDIYLSGESNTSPVDINLQMDGLEIDHPASPQQNAPVAKSNTALNHDRSQQKPYSGSFNPTDLLSELRSRLSAARNANNSASDSYVSEIKKILYALKRNHAREDSSASISPPNRIKSSDVLEIARIFALLLKFYGLTPETKDMNDVAREISRILLSEKCESNSMPPKPAKGIANIAIHVEDLRNLVLSPGNGSNSANIPNAKSGSSEMNSVVVDLHNRASQFGSTLPAWSGGINFAGNNEKTTATLNHQESDMKCVELANHVNDARFSQSKEISPASATPRIDGKLVDQSKPQASEKANLNKGNVISATSELLDRNFSSEPGRNSPNTNPNTQKSDVEIGNETDLGRSSHASPINRDSTKNAELHDDSASESNSRGREKKADATRSQEPEVASHGSEHRVTQGGVPNLTVVLDDSSSINSDPESMSSFSTDTFDFAEVSSSGDDRLSPASVSGVPDIDGNLNSSVKTFCANVVNLEENGSANFTPKCNSVQIENNAGSLQEQETISTCNQGHEADAAGALVNEDVFPCRIPELECFAATSKVNCFRDFVSPLNCGGSEDFVLTSNCREPVTRGVDPAHVSLAPEDDKCLLFEGPMHKGVPVTSDLNGFTDYVSPVGNGKPEYYTTTTNKQEPATVGTVNMVHFNGYPWMNNLTNFGKAPLAAYSPHEIELGAANAIYPGPFHLPVNWIAPAYAPFASEYNRCFSYGAPWQEYHRGYWDANNYAINTIYQKPEVKAGVAANYKTSMVSPTAIRRKYASCDSGNDRHLSFEVHNHDCSRANSEPNHFSGIDVLRNDRRSECFTATTSHQEHIPAHINVGDSSGVSQSQTYGTNSTLNSISTQQYRNEVTRANRASGFNSTSFSPINASSKRQHALGEVNFANLTNVLGRVSQSSTEPPKASKSSRAATSLSSSLYCENYPSDPSQMETV
ncbi:unnamed protein product [Hymenolepis diminuta]|uniref:Uncharacterized protein n=1 Tax=Hymenolepis diminuta TaxID=6216 RepID=A0A564YIQ0_HYMDI|nr:unnamed protein product [Hymenolepis diminuta]